MQKQKEKIKSYRIIDELKTTGGQIGNYLLVHKKEIIELSKENKNAKEICNYFCWLNEKITKEDVLKEINEYLQNQKEKITSYTAIKDTLKTLLPANISESLPEAWYGLLAKPLGKLREFIKRPVFLNMTLNILAKNQE